ncbi:MAG: Asp23/Gls24 family envelope stress response protein [Anaerolineaceae bacterium]|nr:Asp23/Gls24 family envelope stress response protein [Anaerolineaceae bacterium]
MDEKQVGSRTIAPEVLNSIARLTTLGVTGVSRMAPVKNTYEDIIIKPEYDGVKVLVKDDFVYLDIFVILNSEENVRIVSKNIQERVTRAVSEMVGMEVASVNIHISDIAYED